MLRRARGIHRAFLMRSRFAHRTSSWKIPSKRYLHQAEGTCSPSPVPVVFTQLPGASSAPGPPDAWSFSFLCILSPPPHPKDRETPTSTRTEEPTRHSDVPALTSDTLWNTEHSLKLRSPRFCLILTMPCMPIKLSIKCFNLAKLIPYLCCFPFLGFF